MKKIIISFLIISCFFGTAVMAQNLGGDKLGQVVGGVKEISKTGLEDRVGGIIAAILSMLGTIFLVLTIYAGVLWMTASGDEGKITKAKDIFKPSIIGMAIVMSAYTITFFVGSRLGQ
jgi:preprotein translocase subunit SecG